jgi:hypothetical protein
MLYLLDANVLIDANRDYYPISRVPEFWAWLEHQGTQNSVKMPPETYDEIRRGNDALAEWSRQRAVTDALLMADEVNINLVQHVTDIGYGENLTDVEVGIIGQDPFLVAHCLANPAERRVVTTERSKPMARRANRKVPDVCAALGVRSIHTYELVRELDFSTGWQRR